MKTVTTLFIIVLTSIASGLSFAFSPDKIHQWEVFSVSFTSNEVKSNPYAEISVGPGTGFLNVLFQGTSGEALNESYTIIGFWNGGSEWTVNFAPPFTGGWKYSTPFARELRRVSQRIIASPAGVR